MISSVLILGFSSIASRRVIPALLGLSPPVRVDIASASKEVPDTLRETGRVFGDYAQALERSEAEVVYVSLHNAAHFEWSIKALNSGRHVIVDKPAFLRIEESDRALDLARKAGRHIAEATVFNYHSQFLEIDRCLAQYGPLSSLSAEFIIPPLPISNFRVQRALGGGCYADMSSYAAAIVRLFGQGELAMLAGAAGPRPRAPAADTAFSMLAAFPSGLRITGHFGIEASYRNRITLMARDAVVEIDRVFSAPPDFSPTWRMTRRNEETTKTLDRDDAFRSFFVRVFEAFNLRTDLTFESILLQDARFRDRLAVSASIDDR